MPRPGFQWTLGQLIRLIVVCALLPIWLRIPGGPVVLALTSLVILCSLLDRIRGGDGIIGGTVSGGIVFGGYEFFSFVFGRLFSNPSSDSADYLMILPLSPVAGVIWGFAVSMALYFATADFGRCHRANDERKPQP